MINLAFTALDHEETSSASAAPGTHDPRLPDRSAAGTSRHHTLGATGVSLPDRLCRAARQFLAMESAAISISLGTGLSSDPDSGPDICVPVGASDPDAAAAEALEFTLGEGPSTHAHTTRSSVTVFDITQHNSAAWSAWPTYTAELFTRTRYRTVFVFPLVADGDMMGTLTLYGNSRNTVAGTAAIGTTAWVANQLLATHDTQFTNYPDHRWLETPLALRRYLVWKAQGLTMQTNHLSASQALDLLRAHAYTHACLLEDLAHDILAQHHPVPGIDSH